MQHPLSSGILCYNSYMNHPGLKLWLQTNKYLLGIFSLVFILVGILLINFITIDNPTINAYLGKGGLSKEARLVVTATTTITDQIYQTGSINPKAYNSLVNLAETTDYIEIGTCSPYPGMYKVVHSDTVVLRNSSFWKHTILFSDGQKFTIKPWSQITFSARFSQAPSVQPYFCDQSKTPSGALWVVQFAL